MSMNNNLDFINQFQERIKNVSQQVAMPQVSDYTNHQPNALNTYQYLNDSSIQLRNALSRLMLMPDISAQDLHELIECLGRIEHIAKKVSELQGNYK